MQEESKKEKSRMGLTTKIFIGLLGGLLLGVVLNLWVPHSYFRDEILVDGIFYVAGNGFIRLMKMLVVPLVFCSLVCGSSAIGDTKSLGRVGGRTIGFYLVTTALAVTVAILVATIVRPGVGLDMSSIETGETAVAENVSVADTILNIIPENPIGALADGTMLQIILFALLVGVLLAKMGDRAELLSGIFNQGNELMMEMTNMIMSLAPAGVFCMIAKTFANLGFDAFLPLLKYMGSVLLGLVIQCLGVLPGSIRCALSKSFSRLWRLRFLPRHPMQRFR